MSVKFYCYICDEEAEFGRDDVAYKDLPNDWDWAGDDLLCEDCIRLGAKDERPSVPQESKVEIRGPNDPIFRGWVLDLTKSTSFKFEKGGLYWVKPHCDLEVGQNCEEEKGSRMLVGCMYTIYACANDVLYFKRLS